LRKPNSHRPGNLATLGKVALDLARVKPDKWTKPMRGKLNADLFVGCSFRPGSCL